MTDTLVVVDTATINAQKNNYTLSTVGQNSTAYPANLTYDEITENLLQSLTTVTKENVSNVIFCSAQGNSHVKDYMFELEKTQKKVRAKPSDALETTDTGTVLKLTKYLPAVTDIFKVDTACASGIKGLEIAGMIAERKNAVVLVFGVECSATGYISFSFNSLKAVSNGLEYRGPFDINRSGFALGEGGAAIAICTKTTAKKLKLPVKAVINCVNFFTSCTSSPSQPSEYHKLKNFIDHTISSSKIIKNNFAYWDAHATATPLGDKIEYDLFNDANTNMPISSFKGAIGHCMAASSLIEIVNGIEHLQQGIIPKNYNLYNKFVDDERIILHTESTTLRTFIKCSFGFGGRNGATVITVE